MKDSEATLLTPAVPAGRVLDYVPGDPERSWWDRWGPPVLVAVTAAVAGVMYALGRATALEAVSFVTGALCVWLTVRESVWNFPVSLLNVTTFAVVFFRVRLFADAGLQVVYFVLTLVGWYLWLYGGQRRTALKVSRAGGRGSWPSSSRAAPYSRSASGNSCGASAGRPRSSTR